MLKRTKITYSGASWPRQYNCLIVNRLLVKLACWLPLAPDLLLSTASAIAVQGSLTQSWQDDNNLPVLTLSGARHMAFERPPLAGIRMQFSSLLLSCPGVMRRLLWPQDQHEVCRYIMACLDKLPAQRFHTAPPRCYLIRLALLAARDEYILILVLTLQQLRQACDHIRMRPAAWAAPLALHRALARCNPSECRSPAAPEPRCPSQTAV